MQNHVFSDPILSRLRTGRFRSVFSKSDHFVKKEVARMTLREAQMKFGEKQVQSDRGKHSRLHKWIS